MKKKKNVMPPLANWLLKYARNVGVEIQYGNKKVGKNLVEGWLVQTSTDLKIFWVAEHHRTLVGAKYLSPSGEGLQPTLLLNHLGLINYKKINQTVLTQLKKEGLALVEGLKGAIALSAMGFNVCTIGGCSGGIATLKILNDWGISSEVVKYIFADTDILHNPKVLQGYKNLAEACIYSQVLVYPPQNFILDGQINLEKFSPDDWVDEGDNREIIFKKVHELKIEAIEKYHQNFRIIEKNEIQFKRGKSNIEAIHWLLDFLTGRLIYVSEISTYFYYRPIGYWTALNNKTLLDQILAEIPTNLWTYQVLENALKLVAPKFLMDYDETMKLFCSRQYIGFQNGVWDLEALQLFAHKPQQYINGLLPFNYVPLDGRPSLQTICPVLCAWIADRVDHEEIYTNILIGFLLLAVLDVRNPERFLFLSGYSSSGKSTYLKLLQNLVPSNKSYVTTAETIAGNFGLQDFTGLNKTVLICHDIGSTVSVAFVNLLRNLVSSGETQHVQRKFERAAPMQFEGVVALASNKNPFTHQQREGIIDRRMIYVPFTNRVPTNQIRDFDKLFPPKELEQFANFALLQDISLVVQFIRQVNDDLMVRQVLLESFKDNPKSLNLQNFIARRMTYCVDVWIPLGSPEDADNFHEGASIYCAYRRYTNEQGVAKQDIFSYMNFRQELLPLITRLNPHWNVFERRRIHDGRKVIGLLNIQLTSGVPENLEISTLDLTPFRREPFWVVPSQGLEESARVSEENPASRRREEDQTVDPTPLESRDDEAVRATPQPTSVQRGTSEGERWKTTTLRQPTPCDKGWKGLNLVSAVMHHRKEPDAYCKLPCDQCVPECDLFGFTEKHSWEQIEAAHAEKILKYPAMLREKSREILSQPPGPNDDAARRSPQGSSQPNNEPLECPPTQSEPNVDGRSVVDESERPSSDQTPDGRSMVDEPERPFDDQTPDGRSMVDAPERPSNDQTPDGRSARLPDMEDLQAIQDIKYLLMKVPQATDEEPNVIISPSLDILQNLFQTNPVIALDTEFTLEKTARLAYIQIGFLHSRTVCILTHATAFTGFKETFWDWLQGDVAVIGFFLLVDLNIVWRHFAEESGSETLLYKIFDLYTFLKFIHNGFKHRNSLADWSKRLIGIELDKTAQKTDWLNAELNPNLIQYMMNDVFVLHHLLNYVQKISHLYYLNTWTGQKHFYFETSYQLDQVLIPCFLDLSLQGITISSENLDKTHSETKTQTTNLLRELGLTESQYRSSKQFTDFIEHTTQPISGLASLWPRTNTGFFNKSQTGLSAWLTSHTADPRFQNSEIVQWFTQILALAQAETLGKFCNTFKKHIENDKIFPLWDLMGADTGRITTSHPALHSTPRDSTARSIVVPSQPNNVFVIADYRTIEVVIQAILAKENTMLHVFRNSLDLHMFLASKILNREYESLMQLKQTDPKEFKRIRNSMKPVNFGKIYGMGAKTLWQRFLTLGQNMTFDEANNLHCTWDKTFPQIQAYQQSSKTKYYTSTAPLTRLGGTNYITSLSGRLRRPEIPVGNAQPYLNFTQIVNFPIQASCTDFLKTSLRGLYVLIKLNQLPATIVLSAHDEIILECQEQDAQMVAQLLTKVMVDSARDILSPIYPNAPIEVDLGIGRSWADKP